MDNKRQYLLETDIIADYLVKEKKPDFSDFELAMITGICFTTVLNTSELFFAASNDDEFEKVKRVIKSVKVLGINSRYSLNISDFFNKVATARDALMCSVAKNNKLPILTNKIDKYKNSGLIIINANELRV